MPAIERVFFMSTRPESIRKVIVMQKQLLKLGHLATQENLEPLIQGLRDLLAKQAKAHKAKNKDTVRVLGSKPMLSEKQREKLAKAIAQLSTSHRFHLGAWHVEGKKMLSFLKDREPRFTVFMEGNSKLPFYAFSALPIITCIGFGACGKYCYSFKAWRYPSAFFRQLQNTLLILRDKETLAKKFNELPANIDFRLYVDGDFDSIESMRFWFNQLELRPDIKAYGYSKSWPLFLSYNKTEKFPQNYLLNLSAGSRYNAEYLAAMEKLDCVRGEFVAFPVTTKEKDNRAKYRREVKQAAKNAGHKKVFVCPSKCGECVLGGIHACGSAKFKGITVAIGLH